MLGLQLGRLPSELSETMLAAEETLLMSYYREDPWGDHRADIRSAQVCQILWNSNCSKKENRKKITDFLPFYRKKATVDENVGDKLKDRFLSLMGKPQKD